MQSRQLVPWKWRLQRSTNCLRSASLRTVAGSNPVIFTQRSDSRRVSRNVLMPRSTTSAVQVAGHDRRRSAGSEASRSI